jgi:hypothetical protein
MLVWLVENTWIIYNRKDFDPYNPRSLSVLFKKWKTFPCFYSYIETRVGEREIIHVISSSPKQPRVFLYNCIETQGKNAFYLFYNVTQE